MHGAHHSRRDHKRVIYSPLSQDTLDDPHVTYAKLRTESPILWHAEMGCWVVSRYAECVRVLTEPQLFARDRRRVSGDVAGFRASVQSLDPPDQTPLRTLVGQHIRDAAAGLQGRADDFVQDALTRVSGSREFDWMQTVAAPLALFLTSQVLGVAIAEEDGLHLISEAIAFRMDAGLDASTVAAGDLARDRLDELVLGWRGQRHALGPLDLDSHATAADIDADWIGSTFAVMCNASYGTIYASVGNLAHTLLEHPEVQHMLDSDADLGLAVDELLRYDGPAQGTSRTLVADAVLGGVEIQRGDVVLALLASANRDDNVFLRADELILDRAPNPHLAFGRGPHSCLGGSVGKIAMKAVIQGLISAQRPLSRAGTSSRRRTATLRSMAQFPVSFRGSL